VACSATPHRGFHWHYRPELRRQRAAGSWRLGEKYMTGEQLIVFGVLAATLVLFVWYRGRCS
jgi:hypothetical protein